MAKRHLKAGIAAGELRDGLLIGGEVYGDPLVVVRYGGKLCALAGTCTHLKAHWRTACWSTASGAAPGITRGSTWPPVRRSEVLRSLVAMGSDNMIAEKIDCSGHTLLERVKKAEVNSGKRAGVPTKVADKVKALEREVRELRQAEFLARARHRPVRASPKRGVRKETNPGLFWSVAFAIRRTRFAALGGLDEGFTGYGAGRHRFRFPCVCRGS